MHVAGHGRVHKHEDGTRHVHQGGKPEGRKHHHQDGTTHDHKTGKHLHKDGTSHQHAVKPAKPAKPAKPKMDCDEMACCPTEGMKKAACCPSCGNAACTCCKTAAPKDTSVPQRPSVQPTTPTTGAGTTSPTSQIQTLGLPLLTWLKSFL